MGLRCERCGKVKAEGSWDVVNWVRDHCEKCHKIAVQEYQQFKKNQEKEEIEKKKREERERARWKEQEKKRKRDRENWEKGVIARGGKICHNCGHEMRGSLPDLKTGESIYTCMHCRDHYRIIMGKG